MKYQLENKGDFLLEFFLQTTMNKLISDINNLYKEKLS